jgi:hypothetical protein
MRAWREARRAMSVVAINRQPFAILAAVIDQVPVRRQSFCRIRLIGQHWRDEVRTSAD